jgi:hypothetical protein
MLAVVLNTTMSTRTTHLLLFWMKHLFTQIESEFTPKLLRADIPSYEYSSPDKFQYYQEIFKLYSQLSLEDLTSNFKTYIKKLLRDVLPSSKARYLLTRMIIIDSNRDVIFNHSFVKDTARNVDFFNSEHFRFFLYSFENIRRK